MGAVLLRNRKRLPRSVGLGDIALLSTATFKLARLVSRDAVMSPARAPFTRYIGQGEAPAEVNEEVRGSGVRKAIGELVTCPYCLGQWVATGFIAGWIVAPRATRVIAATLTVAATSDAMQLAYTAAVKGTH
jgi:hypothetical protein